MLPAKFEDYVMTEEHQEEVEEIVGYAYLIIEDGGKPEPANYQDALHDPDSDKWIQDSDEEILSLIKNKTWELVERVETQKPIG